MNVSVALDLRSQAARNPLAASFAVSLAIHLLFFGAYKLMPASFMAGQGVLARFLASLTLSERAEQKRLDEIKQSANQKLFEEMLRQQKQQEIPMTFIEVDPVTAGEAPKNPKYYATHDTVAANPEPNVYLDQPKIEGADPRVPVLFENPRPQPKPAPAPLQPFQPVEPAPLQPQKHDTSTELRPDSKPDAKSEPYKPLEKIADRTHEKTPDKPDLKKPGGENPGQLAMATPHKNDLPNKIPGSGSPAQANPLITEPSAPGRPRTLADAYQRNPALAGRLMQQDGGVRKRGRITVDAKGSPFGAYDAAFIAAVQERWYQLLERNPTMLSHQGKVVLDFQLRFDGRIMGLAVEDNTVSETMALLCRRAVEDPAPYARWPGDMRRMIGTDSREVRFTFYYD